MTTINDQFKEFCNRPGNEFNEDNGDNEDSDDYLDYELKFLNQMDFLTPDPLYYNLDGAGVLPHIINIFLVFHGARCGTYLDDGYGGEYIIKYMKVLDEKNGILGWNKDDNGVFYIWNKILLPEKNILLCEDGEFISEVTGEDITTFLENQESCLQWNDTDQNVISKKIESMKRGNKLYDRVKKEKYKNNLYSKALGYYTRDYIWHYLDKKYVTWCINVYEINTNTCVINEIINFEKIKGSLSFYNDKIDKMNKSMGKYNLKFEYILDKYDGEITHYNQSEATVFVFSLRDQDSSSVNIKVKSSSHIHYIC